MKYGLIGWWFGWINLDINNEIELDLKWILKMGNEWGFENCLETWVNLEND